MSLIIQANLPFINAQNKYKTNVADRAKTTEKLASGYRINRAADDAAGLTISEKMRRQIRGLERGTLNGQDGVSWVQTGDGALNEVHAILHRMKELTVQALNDTNTESDRAALQAEMDALQSEIDRITDTTQFNTKNIFAEHEATYYQYEGNVKWEQSQRHVINAGENDLVIKYQENENSPVETVSITVPAGEYTTQELTDEIENALIASGAHDKGVVVEYTDQGTFNINLEGGEKIEEVTGDLAYLLYDTYKGGSVGALIGTTAFESDKLKLAITSENNNLSFDIEYFDGTTDSAEITIPNGSYTRPELIDILNNKFSDKGIEATAYGTGIKLGSNDAIITGFKGNMFKIDGGVNPHTSVFYDNVYYGNVTLTAASFEGGAVIPESLKDEEHKTFVIDSNNNQLTFTANGSNTPVTITIPNDEYTITEMRDKLNELFADNDLELNATVYDTTASNTNGYLGLKIASTVKGSISQVGLDSSSSAYNTLFVKRVYNSYSNNAVVTRDTTDNRQAYFTGSKVFENPLSITDDNNEFKLVIDNSEYTIALDTGITYNTADELRGAISDKLNGSSAVSGYKGRIDVSVENGKIKLTATENSGIIAFEVKTVDGDNGYDDIFVGKKTNVTYTSVSDSASNTEKPSIELNGQNTYPMEINAPDNKLTVTVNGVDKTVTLPTGTNVTQDQIVNSINTQLAEKTITTNNRFDDLVNKTGTTTYNHFTYNGVEGDTYVQGTNYSKTGSADTNEGSLLPANNKPAVVEMSVSVPDSMTINNTNNALQITINGNTKAITLDNQTYSKNQMVSELQKKINASFGTGIGGAVVTLNNDSELVFTARIDEYTDGRTTNISFSTGSSSFISALHTKNSAGYVDTNAMLSSINITAGNTFSFDYMENGVAKTADITFDETKTYDRSGYVSMLNKKLDEAGIKITASVNGTRLRLTTDTKGDNNSVSFSTYTAGDSVESIFGPMVTKNPATAISSKPIQENIIIDSTSNQYNITVNGNDYNLTLTENLTGYSRQEFIDELNNQFIAEGVEIRATLDSDRIKYATTNVGSDASFSITYDTGGSSMLPIYGQSTTVYPGVTASFVNNKLVLTGTQNGGSLSVNSNSGSLLQKPNITTTDEPISKDTGYYSGIYASVDGASIGNTVIINQWNDDMSFVYYANGTQNDVSITLPQKEYTHDELQAELQNQIDNQVGANQLDVTVDSNGVVITAKNAGSKYYMLKSDFSGGFYNKVMCTTTEITSNQTPKISNGTTYGNRAFTVGRKDVKNKEVEIKAGINDTLSLDFKYGNNTTTFDIKLDVGTYKGESLKNMLQEKLNEELKNQGFSENLIEVGIGGVSTGVVGANDANALNFKLSTSVRLPGEGEYIIDGVSGNAAFSVFYQTDGELVPAYVKGAKDISEGVTIEAGKEDLSFDVEGVTYTITLDAKDYTVDELIDAVNEKLTAEGAPVTAENDDGVLKISHNKIGERKINNITGGAKNVLFFQENGQIGEDEDIKIQLSSEVGDYISIDRPVLNTVSLGINSIAISKPKYANKALTRIDKALEKVSNIRSDFGAKQNRLEHAIEGNKNAVENTQAAESRLRDLDMSEAMVKYSKQNILIQVGEAMMAQANTNAEGVLRLLQ